MVLADLKILLDTNETEDPLLAIYIRKATTLITNYLNLRSIVDISVMYPDAVIEYVTINYNKKGNEGIKQFKFENTEATYNDDGIPKSVKDLLPLPFIRML